ncbi:hypothetical protein JCM33374_g1701 [Metschnikowia sp. JCM 33374]|nr:hypothetical protein JCM33374_g1701 [Metschnikowia sp. JCM 33374]
MTSENDFSKPNAKPVVRTPPLRGTAASAGVARDMVSLHLQGRNPQRVQTTTKIHAQTRSADAFSASRTESAENPGLVSLSRPNTGQIPISARRVGPTIGQVNTETQTPRPKSNIIPNTATNNTANGLGTLAANSSMCGAKHAGNSSCSTQNGPQPSISVNDWSIYTTKGPICSSDELDHLNATRFDFPLPEMIFGGNRVRLVNEKTDASIEFNTLDALDSLAPTADFKVAYYKEWLSTRPKAKASDSAGPDGLYEDSGSSSPVSSAGSATTVSMTSAQGTAISSSGTQRTAGADIPTPSSGASPDLQSVKPYDWTYSTNYKGTLTKCKFSPYAQDIPLEKLVRQDPILFYDESILFEDELGDNGISMFSTKVRVMPSCLLLLCRFSMRVDDVAFRIRDTRVYIDLETNLVLREYKTQQASYSELLGKISGRSTDPKKLLRDSNWVSQNTPVVSREVEIMQNEQDSK